MRFTTVEVVKGEVEPHFALTFGGPPRNDFKDEANADFRGHADWGVWERRFTREGNGPDCQIHPRFEAGATYLVFLGPPYHWH